MVQLIEAVLNKDQKAYKLLYDMFSIQMFNIAYRILGSEAEAEDVLQEIFIRVFQQLEKLENKELFPAWIKRITINTSLEQVRKQKKIRFDVLDDNLYQLPDQLDEEERKEEFIVADILNAMMQLSKPYRIVFTLHSLEDLTHEEIAKILNISSSTVRSQYARARKKILDLILDKPGHVRQSKKIYPIQSIGI